uniref:Glycolipid transfer protein n=1 Tax=Anser brachyrhynchus TaxID=132585 RepID=A0A8B9CWL0_9AVES
LALLGQQPPQPLPPPLQLLPPGLLRAAGAGRASGAGAPSGPGPTGPCPALPRPYLSGRKIRAVYDSDPAKFKTLQDILQVEKEMGLKFMLVLLQSISDGERDEEHPNLIRVNALKAYEVALKKYHGWMLQKLFMGSVYALPYKSDLLKALEKGKEVKEEESIEKIHQFVSRVTPILDAIYEMYAEMNAELSYKA